MTAGQPPLTWVVGAGGLLGQHVVAVLRGRAQVLDAPRVPWTEPDQAARVLADTARALLAAAGDGPWQVVWCAGAGVTGSSAESFEAEHSLLVAALEGLHAVPAQAARGVFFLASSAGGVYAGAGAAPYDESSPTKPLAAYGWAKLRAEQTVTDWARGGTPVVIGRIANLYGPGQNLDKPQGLVSQLCAAYLERRPASIWVSLDTLRDYLYAPDCAQMVLDCLDRARSERAPQHLTSTADSQEPLVVVKILATQRAITVGAVIADLRRIFRRRPTIVLGASPVSALQSRDLSLRSRVWPELDQRTLTTFPAGVSATLQDLRERLQSRGS
ncbi:NAD-dependent epimerase/dehydratase family protein [Humibacillus xanthopallidus]|uniref:UDP-glucose 4-epimerase n=1 Tax=Humibacillus xanthopallidus TaxID=412689 RepID=A0A543HZX5_9MICO|nr:NAD(P)-dependent oxidoreductase [Humibacillus xanthopallidus]TQM63884.1 UDP-glucose 4-epimerase [Humibacillus xanthopallidus]